MAYKSTGSSSLTGPGVEGRPLSGEKSGGPQKSTSMATPSSGVRKSDPLGASYDSRPRSGDNAMGATRSKSGGGSGGSGGSTRVKNVC